MKLESVTHASHRNSPTPPPMTTDFKRLDILHDVLTRVPSVYRVIAPEHPPVVLKSGATSRQYLDLRSLPVCPGVVAEAARALCPEAAHALPSRGVVCGVPHGAVPVAAALATQFRMPLVTLRKDAKGYGLGPQRPGSSIKGLDALADLGIMPTACTLYLVEDVVTTGGSVQAAADALAAAGFTNIVVLALAVRCPADVGRWFTAKLADRSARYLWTLADFEFVHRVLGLRSVFAGAPTHVCPALDVGTYDEFRRVLDPLMDAPVPPRVVKTHINLMAITDVPRVVEHLQHLRATWGLVVWEDAKVVDVGHVAVRQVWGGTFNVASWADVVSVHGSMPPGAIDALGPIPKIFVTEMSNAGGVRSSRITARHLPHCVGVVAQSAGGPTSTPVPLITPGVVFGSPIDARVKTEATPGQAYRSVVDCVDTDVFVVGSALCNADDVGAEWARHTDMLK